MKLILITLISTFFTSQAFAIDSEKRIEELKKQIFELAGKYEQLAAQGEGDEDLSKQASLEALVFELIQLNPQPKVEDRISLIVGVWRQVWGPYNYRSADRIVPEGTYVKEIYQTVFADGFYYNVSPSKLFNTFEYISLLRGEYTLSDTNLNGLDVRFTNLRYNRIRPNNINIWELAALAETGNLPQPFNIFPDFIVQNNFEGGTLNEVYTDSDMRVLYGTSSSSFVVPFIYIMEKVDEL